MKRLWQDYDKIIRLWQDYDDLTWWQSCSHPHRRKRTHLCCTPPGLLSSTPCWSYGDLMIWWFDDLMIWVYIWWFDGVTMLCWWYKDLSLSSLIHPQLRITLSSPRTERQSFKFFNSISFENYFPMRDSKIIIRQHKFSLATISLKKSFKLSL